MDIAKGKNQMGKIVVCGSCSASFEEDLGKCPYCGSTNIKGAEREYMGKLEDVRKDMGELNNVPLEELQAAVKKQGHFLKMFLIVVLVIAAAAVLILFALTRREKRDYKEQYLWQQEYFPQLSQFYDNGEYDAMLELAAHALADNPSATLWDWEHYNFYNAYFYASNFEFLLREREKGDLSESGYSSLFFEELALVCLEEFEQAKYTKKELEVLAPYIELARKALASDWGMSDQEYKEFLLLAEENHYIVPYNRCEDFVKQWLKEQK